LLPRASLESIVLKITVQQGGDLRHQTCIDRVEVRLRQPFLGLTTVHSCSSASVQSESCCCAIGKLGGQPEEPDSPDFRPAVQSESCCCAIGKLGGQLEEPDFRPAVQSESCCCANGKLGGRPEEPDFRRACAASAHSSRLRKVANAFTNITDTCHFPEP
jgi:hypothetical protein